MSGLEIMEGLGSTEVLHIYLSNTPQTKKPGAAGKRVPGYEIVLRDSDGREVEDGAEGILWVRGDSNSPGYWNRPDKTAETMREDGWIYTGDRFVRDADGFHFFRGRADDLVKVSRPMGLSAGGRAVPGRSPGRARVRRACRDAGEPAHRAQGLRRAGRARGRLRTRPRGCCRTTSKAGCCPTSIPRLVEYLDELPKTGTGKIDRQALLARKS